MDKIPIPPITLCPEILDIDMSIVDPDLFLDQFYKLNEEIRIRVTKGNDFEEDLRQGQNFDQHGELLVTLRELWHPYMGLCYVLDPNTRRLNFGVEDALIVSIFLKGKKGNAMKVLLHNKENIEFVNFPDFGQQTPVISTLDGGTNTGMDLRKSFRQQMSSKERCMIYQDGDSIMKCLARQQLECFYSNQYGCRTLLTSGLLRGKK